MPSSLLSKYLTSDIASALGRRRTANGVTLDDITRSGRAMPNSVIGIYAGDAETYDTFRALLDPLIVEYHGLTSGVAQWPGKKAKSPVSAFKLHETEHFVSARVRFARNIEGYNLPACMSASERAAVEARVVDACSTLPSLRSGQYFPLATMDDALRARLEQQHLLFRALDPYMAAAGITADWPANRGVFLASDHRLMIWINEEDHLRIAALAPGGDLAAAHATARAAIEGLQGQLKFQCNDRLGHLSSCPSNLGTGMRASFLMHLNAPARSGDAGFKALAHNAGLELRGSSGEGSAIQGDLYDIGVAQRLKFSEAEILHRLRQGAAMLLDEELRCR